MVGSPKFSVLKYVRVPSPIVDGDAFPSWAYQMQFILFKNYNCWKIIYYGSDKSKWSWELDYGKDEVDNLVTISPSSHNFVAGQCFKLENDPRSF